MMAVVAALSLMVMACGEAAEEPGDQSGLANPASAYCEEQGGTVEMRLDDTGGTYGVCVFPDGSECEEWAYFRGECSPGGEGVVMTVDEVLGSDQQGPITVIGYLFVDREGRATLASMIAESFPPQAAGATIPVQVDLSKFSFSEDQGLRWTDQMVNVEGTLVDGVLVGLAGD
jgi:putative hemolysin